MKLGAMTQKAQEGFKALAEITPHGLYPGIQRSRPDIP